MKDYQNDLIRTMINNNIDDKVYFQPGDVVQLKQDIPNSPTMLVVRVERYIIKQDTSNPPLRGIKTRWFTDSGQLQEAVFSTKDLIKIK